MGLLTADPDILQGHLVQSKLPVACPQQSDPSVRPGIQVPKGRVHRITLSPGSSHRSLALRLEAMLGTPRSTSPATL